MSHSKTQPGALQEEHRFAELDGLRALAVVSVILFHCEVSGLLSAGFFGVDIFFMISGFIITAKLMDEVRRKGDFRFPTFYFRRLKRLMPPVLGLIVLAAVTVPSADDAFDHFRSDVPAALAYVSNWWQIFHAQGYFDTTPLVLKHLWSLAVEEQFYFLWPALAWLALKRYGEKATGALALLLALASTAWMAWLFQPDIDSALRNRLYLGSDTHAMGLFAGAALAGFWNPWRAAAREALARWCWRIAALAALAILGWMMQAMNNDHPWTYEGAFLLVPLLTCVVAYTAMGDRGFLLSRLLRTAVMQWLGGRSYSLYLVHWLVFTWMRLHGWTDFAEPAVLAGGLLAVGVLAELLYRCTEAPMKKFDTRGLDARQMKTLVVSYSGAVLALFAGTALYGIRPAPLVAATPAAQESPAQAPVAPVAPGTTAAAPAIGDEEFASNERISGGDDLFAIGDSVLKGAQAHLEKVIPGIRIDAAVGRQASQGLKVIQAWRAAGGKAQTVLVHLGTNGYITESQYRALLAELADREHVLLVNVHVPKPWMKPNNEIIARMPADFPNVRVIDWDALSAARPAFFGKDNTHLTMKGVRALTAQIKDATGGTVIMPASEQDTMLAKSKEPVPAPAAGKAAAALHKEAPKEAPKETPQEAAAMSAPPAAEPSAAHEAGENASRQPPEHAASHPKAEEAAANHLAHPSPTPSEAQPTD
ncbi:acyltransferase family protein [Massilia brevitalea]|uniref:acyltransferase family protein n=1 Tax=Massilia brevitalea TaxID=442526 RepID=UPI002738667B|nr:acyltransferase family protein [Massilia brevitalea]